MLPVLHVLFAAGDLLEKGLPDVTFYVGKLYCLILDSRYITFLEKRTPYYHVCNGSFPCLKTGFISVLNLEDFKSICRIFI